MTLPAKTRLFIDGLRIANQDRAIFMGGSGAVQAQWRGHTLSSVFQPIVKSNNPEAIYGYEAFVRVIDQSHAQISPEILFAKASDHDSIIGLDRLCRTIHLLNFILNTDGQELLFLNVNEGLISAVDDNHGSAFRKVVDALGFTPNRIVIEIPSTLVKDPRRLHFVLQNYRLNSLEVAVNLDSADELKNITDSTPVRFIKVNNTLLSKDTVLQQNLRSLITESDDINVIVTKNESPLLDICSEKYFLQGFAYGKPLPLTKDVDLASSIESSAGDAYLHIGG